MYNLNDITFQKSPFLTMYVQCKKGFIDYSFLILKNTVSSAFSVCSPFYKVKQILLWNQSNLHLK